MAKAKGFGIVGLVVVVFVLIWLFHSESYSAQLSSDVATGKPIPIPLFGTDNILDAADAVATMPPLTLPKLGESLPGPTNATGF